MSVIATWRSTAEAAIGRNTVTHNAICVFVEAKFTCRRNLQLHILHSVLARDNPVYRQLIG